MSRIEPSLRRQRLGNFMKELQKKKSDGFGVVVGRCAARVTVGSNVRVPLFVLHVCRGGSTSKALDRWYGMKSYRTNCYV